MDGPVRVKWDDKTRVGRKLESWADFRAGENELVVPDVTTMEAGDTVAIRLNGDVSLVYTLTMKEWEDALRQKVVRLKRRFYLTVDPVAAQYPSEEDPRIIGVLKPREEAGESLAIVVGNVGIPVAGSKVPRRFRATTTLFGVWGMEAVKPFITEVSALGPLAEDEQGEFLMAEEIAFTPLPDSTHFEDPSLPRLLVIGDSISGNYDASLREALRGKVNVYHPPGNAGNTRHGARKIKTWLGAYWEKGRSWDAISFNFGHWNSTGAAGIDREQLKSAYQAGLEGLISEMEKTNAQLIWVTTTPIPYGFDRGDHDWQAGKNALVNQWAAEVMERHPSIAVVDLWPMVEVNPRYAEWWQRKDVHFSPSLAEPLGQAIAGEVVRVLGQGVAIPPLPHIPAREVAR